MLNWKTCRALPRLRNYADAVKCYETVTPIRGCMHKLRPLGRRDQKWVNIQRNADTGAITIGYGVEHKQYEKSAYNSTLAKFHPDGRVEVNRRLGASDRERVGLVLGLNMERKHNINWVHACSYATGEEQRGWYPMHSDATFILRNNSSPIYTNPAPSVRHTVNKAGMKAVRDEYRAFTTYLRGVGKLGDGMLPRIKIDDTRDMLLAHYGTDSGPIFVPRAGGMFMRSTWFDADTNPVNPYEAKRNMFFNLARSEDTEQMYLAMVWLTSATRTHSYTTPVVAARETLDMFDKLMVQHHANQALTREEVWTPGIIRDRYASILNCF